MPRLPRGLVGTNLSKGIFALVVAGLVVWLYIHFSAKAKTDAVQRVIVLDYDYYHEFKDELNGAATQYKPFDDPAVDIQRKYVRNLQTIDLRDCPSDFQEAFVAWVESMRKDSELLGQNNGAMGTLYGMAQYLDGNNSSDQFQQAAKSSHEEWLKVQVVALRYGVQVDPEAHYGVGILTNY